MTDFNKLSDDLKLLANRLKPLFDAAQAFEQIGSVEQAAREAEIRKSQLNAQADEARSKLQLVVDQLEDQDKRVAAARVEADSILQNAIAKKSDLLSKAKYEAEAIVSEAYGKKSKVAEESKVLRTVLGEQDNLISEKKKELAELQSQVDQVKAKLAQIMKI
jgi:cell division septum initiation protein DivIVA